jgi:hypothetical protein
MAFMGGAFLNPTKVCKFEQHSRPVKAAMKTLDCLERTRCAN